MATSKPTPIKSKDLRPGEIIVFALPAGVMRDGKFVELDREAIMAHICPDCAAVIVNEHLHEGALEHHDVA